MPASTPQDAARRFYLVDKDGLLIEGMNDIAPFQKPFLQPRAALGALEQRQPEQDLAARRHL